MIYGNVDFISFALVPFSLSGIVTQDFNGDVFNVPAIPSRLRGNL